jgi:hypothetical protein
MVALWRRAGTDATAALGVRVYSTALNVNLLPAPAAATNTAATAANAATLTELRSWLAGQFNWRPA